MEREHTLIRLLNFKKAIEIKFTADLLGEVIMIYIVTILMFFTAHNSTISLDYKLFTIVILFKMPTTTLFI